MLKSPNHLSLLTQHCRPVNCFKVVGNATIADATGDVISDRRREICWACLSSATYNAWHNRLHPIPLQSPSGDNLRCTWQIISSGARGQMASLAEILHISVGEGGSLPAQGSSNPCSDSWPSLIHCLPLENLLALWSHRLHLTYLGRNFCYNVYYHGPCHKSQANPFILPSWFGPWLCLCCRQAAWGGGRWPSFLVKNQIRIRCLRLKFPPRLNLF